MRTREELIDWLSAADDWDGVVIIGGGINGIGVFRDLAAQGIGCLLVEKGDFCSGTSAAPSRLIHGGLRYLETGEFALVRESVVERNHLLVNAPHLVRPIPVWVPLFSWTGGLGGALLRFLRLKTDPGPKGALLVRAGLMLFDAFGRVRKTLPSHRVVARSEVAGTLPGLTQRTRAVAEYYDARLLAPERLGLEIIADAEADCPDARAIPYLAVAPSATPGILRLVDRIGGGTVELSPRLVVNCSGAWLDGVNADLGVTERLTGGTRGSHLVLRHPRLAGQLGERMIYFETFDHRACLVYAVDPEHLILGTTDLRVDDAEDVVCSDAEIDYLFGVLTEILPGEKLTRDSIVFTYGGVRPLPVRTSGATGAISRDHSLRTFPPTGERRFPILALVGGKWTTYRACAEQIADAVLAHLGRPRTTSTLDRQIGGGKGLTPDPASAEAEARHLQARTGRDAATIGRLVRRYGTAAKVIAAKFTDEDWQPLATAPAYVVGEIRYIARHERVTRLEDVVLRRTLLPFEGLAREDVVREVGTIVGRALAWTPERTGEEIRACLDLLARRYRVDVGRDTIATGRRASAA